MHRVVVEAYGNITQTPIEIGGGPAVYVISNGTKTDVIPALQLCNAEGRLQPAMFLIPWGSQDDAWRMCYAGHDKQRMKSLKQLLPGIGSGIQLLKWFGKHLGWDIWSIAFTCMVWDARVHLACYWGTGNQLSWRRVGLLRSIFLHYLARGYIPH